MPDWDKIKEQKNEYILIGRCENQALELLKGYNFDNEYIQEEYKKMVKLLYKLNKEVESEIEQNTIKRGKDSGQPETTSTSIQA